MTRSTSASASRHRRGFVPRATRRRPAWTRTICGVVIGVSALIVIMGVMTGLQNDLREKILIGSPDVRVLNYGSDMVLKDWQPILTKARAEPSVVAAAPFVLTKALVGAGH